MSCCTVHFLPAKAGDCILLELDNKDCILIDCGFAVTYQRYLKPLLLQLRNEGCRISLMIVTHFDQDHIEGAIRLLEDNGNADSPSIIPIENIWFNGFFNTLLSLPVFQNRKRDVLSAEEKKKRDDALADLKTMVPQEEGQISASHSKSFETLCVQGGYAVNHHFADRIVRSKANNREEALADSISIAGCQFRVLSPRERQLDTLAKTLDKEMKRWFGKAYAVAQDEQFAQLFELLMGLYQTPLEAEMISANGMSLENWIGTSSLPQMSEVNRASIVVEVEYKGIRMLFTGDGESDDWGTLLAPEYQLIKLAHHGTTKPNLTLLEKTKGERLLISTNGGRGGRHPEDELLARAIFSKPKELFFNYSIARKKVLLGLQEQQGFLAHFEEIQIEV